MVLVIRLTEKPGAKAHRNWAEARGRIFAAKAKHSWLVVSRWPQCSITTVLTCTPRLFRAGAPVASWARKQSIPTKFEPFQVIP